MSLYFSSLSTCLFTCLQNSLEKLHFIIRNDVLHDAKVVAMNESTDGKGKGLFFNNFRNLRESFYAKNSVQIRYASVQWTVNDGLIAIFKTLSFL